MEKPNNPPSKEDQSKAVGCLIFIGIFIALFCYFYFGESEPYGKKITKEEFGKDWPFTVDAGYVNCYDSEVTFETNGKVYALNGTAKTRMPDSPPIEEIWAWDLESQKEQLEMGFSKESVERGKVRKTVHHIIKIGKEICE